MREVREPASAPTPRLCKRLGLSLDWSFALSLGGMQVPLEPATQEPLSGQNFLFYGVNP